MDNFRLTGLGRKAKILPAFGSLSFLFSGSMQTRFDIGFFGLDVLSGSLAQNMASHGVSVAVARLPGAAPLAAGGEGLIAEFSSVEQLAAALSRPRVLLFRSPSDNAGLAAFSSAVSCLEPEDLIIDASDLWFRDYFLRAREAAAYGIHALALGLAPNENSPAPLLMAGGRLDLYGRVSGLLEAGAPRLHGLSGLAHMGADPAGQFVRMAHGAVEHAVREIVREARALLDHGLFPPAGAFAPATSPGPLGEYLRAPGETAVPEDLEVARWAVNAGHELEIPAFTLQAAAGARSWENREILAEPFCQPLGPVRHDPASLMAEAQGAISVAMIIAYTEALAILATASDRFGLRLDIPAALRVWLAGAKWRAPLLESIQTAFQTTPGLPNLLFDEDFSERVMDSQELLRNAIWQADAWNIPTPTLAAALHYIDSFRDAWLPINLVQPDDFHFTPRPHPAYVLDPIRPWADHHAPKSRS